jgi:glyceraldehyde 3-phosphate dehydrogenase
MSIRIAINGFGRIGRQLTRILCTDSYKGLKLVAVNTLENCATAAHLLKYDSIQGVAEADISANSNGLRIAGSAIPFYHEPAPGNIPCQNNKVDVVIECSGHFTNGRQAADHLKAGAKRVVITAAATNPDITICMGVNQESFSPTHHKIISGSSCTTNCLAPIAKLINDNWGIKSALATFIHSSTNNQHLLDTGDIDPRRARAAGLNLIPCKTSAAHQIPLVIPQLRHKFEALAIRVPTPDVHLADFTVQLNKNISRSNLLEALQEAADGELDKIMRLSDAPLVSIDFRNASHSCIIDTNQIQVNNNLIKILIWHANEFSYCQRIIDLVRLVG